MAISKQSYKELKEYWDFQRKVEYNREMVHYMAEKFKGRVYNDMGMVHIDEMKTLLWLRVDSKDYEEPRKGYVPAAPKYRFEWEGEANLPTLLLQYDEDIDNG